MATVTYLDGSETIGSLRARMQYADDAQVVLVVPRGVEGLRDPVYLKLLLRAAEDHGVEVALVTRDRRTREGARGEGIPTYSALKQVRRGWLRGRGELRTVSGLALREPRLTPVGIMAALVGGLIVGAAALSVALFVLPSATITLVPAAEAFSQTVEVTATTERTGGTPAEGEIPASVLEVQLEMSDQIPTTGRRQAAADRATGQVTLANRSDTPLQVPRGSRFAVPGGARFYTLDEVTLPAQEWGTARVGIIAAEPGATGNVPAQAINEVVEPALMFRVTVVNENPTGGGSDRGVNYVTLEDRNRLKARLVEKIQVEAAARLMAAKSDLESIYPETVSVTLVEESFDRAAGDEADRLSLRVRSAVRGLSFEGRQANEVAIRLLASRIPRGTELLSGSFHTSPLEAYQWDADSVSFRLLVEGKFSPALDTASIRQSVLGLTVAEAETQLARTLRLAARPQVKVQPTWATTVPVLAPRVSVRITDVMGP